MEIATPALKVAGLVKRFGDTVVLDNIDLTVHVGEVAAVVGGSGAGKSTLLTCINHLETFQAGTVERDGQLVGSPLGRRRTTLKERKSLRAARAAMPMVFQRFDLFANLTVTQNVMLAQRVSLQRSRTEARARALDALSRVRMSDRADAYPHQLSGGQSQRVGIARALAMDPTLLLLDEPTSSLDPSLVGEVVDVITDLANAGMTMVIVSHEMRVVREVATTVHLLAEGNIVESASAATFFTAPTHPATSAFIKAVDRRMS